MSLFQLCDPTIFEALPKSTRPKHLIDLEAVTLDPSTKLIRLGVLKRRQIYAPAQQTIWLNLFHLALDLKTVSTYPKHGKAGEQLQANHPASF